MKRFFKAVNTVTVFCFLFSNLTITPLAYAKTTEQLRSIQPSESPARASIADELGKATGKPSSAAAKPAGKAFNTQSVLPPLSYVYDNLTRTSKDGYQVGLSILVEEIFYASNRGDRLRELYQASDREQDEVTKDNFFRYQIAKTLAYFSERIDDPALRQMMIDLLNREGTRQIKFVVVKKNILGNQMARYFDHDTRQVVIAIDEEFYNNTIGSWHLAHRSDKGTPKGAYRVFGERLLHELAHDNTIGTYEEELAEEARILREVDFYLYRSLVTVTRGNVSLVIRQDKDLEDFLDSLGSSKPFVTGKNKYRRFDTILAQMLETGLSRAGAGRTADILDSGIYAYAREVTNPYGARYGKTFGIADSTPGAADAQPHKSSDILSTDKGTAGSQSPSAAKRTLAKGTPGRTKGSRPRKPRSKVAAVETTGNTIVETPGVITLTQRISIPAIRSTDFTESPDFSRVSARAHYIFADRRAYDTTTGRVAAILRGQVSYAYFSPTRPYLAVTYSALNDTEKTGIIDLKKGQPLEISGLNGGIRRLSSFSKDGGFIAATMFNETTQIIDVTRRAVVLSLPYKADKVRFSPKNKYAIVTDTLFGDAYYFDRLINLKTGQEVELPQDEFASRENREENINKEVSFDEQYVLVHNLQKNSREIYEPATGRTYPLPVNLKDASFISTPDSLLVHQEDGSVDILNFKTRKKEWVASAGDVSKCTVSNDGNMVRISYTDKAHSDTIYNVNNATHFSLAELEVLSDFNLRILLSRHARHGFVLLDITSRRDRANILKLSLAPNEAPCLSVDGSSLVVCGAGEDNIRVYQLFNSATTYEEYLIDKDTAFRQEMEKLGFSHLQKIKQGGQTDVYRAKNPEGKVVAVKIVHSPGATDFPYPEEAQIRGLIARTKGDQHPNVERVTKTGHITFEGKDHTYVVAEYIEGRDLDDVLKEPQSFNRLMHLINGIVAGHNYLRSKGVSHTDVAITNTMVSTSGDAVHIDCLSGSRVRYDHEADIYMAETIMEIITGVNPLRMDPNTRTRYSNSVEAVVAEITKPKYGEGLLAQEIAKIFVAYLNKHTPYDIIHKGLLRLQRIHSHSGDGVSALSYASWKDFEDKKLSGRAIDQSKRNLSEPVKIAFTVDSFAADENVSLLSGINRIFGSLFRLLDGNPNFAPVGIFLGDYAPGTPCSPERLAEFLNSNPALGNSKYKVKLEGNNLIINGRAIPLYSGLPTAQKLQELGVECLVEAPRQRYLSLSIGQDKATAKQEEEKGQAVRLKSYLEADPNLRVVVITPEEDKGSALLDTMPPVVSRINTSAIANSDLQTIVLAEPITAVSSIVGTVVQDALRTQNPKAQVDLLHVEATRTDRQGNRIINVAPITPALGANRIIKGEEKADFATLVTDTGPIRGANAFKLILRVNGKVTITAETINSALREASKGRLKGVIDVRGEDTTSRFEENNQSNLVFLPIKADQISAVRPPQGYPYTTIELRGFYTELGYAKSVLDLITGLSMFDGNEATAAEAVSLEMPVGTIPLTPTILRPQVVPDGQPFLVVLNGGKGRMVNGGLRRLWADPNFQILAINGVRPGKEADTAKFLEFDEVHGEAPFTVSVVPGGKAFKMTDKQECVIPLNTATTATPYGNLIVEQDDGGNIKSIRLHGEKLTKLSTVDNKNGTFTVSGALKSGTTVRVTYSRTGLISAGIRKQLIVRNPNFRPDSSAYTQGKTEAPEVFAKRVDEANRKLARNILAEFPDFNDNVIFLEGSGSLTEAGRLEPFYMAGAGTGLISAPAKATIPGKSATDVTVVTGVNSEVVLSAWDILQTASCASCTTNAAAVGAKAVLGLFLLLSGKFDTIHALTNTQGGPFGTLLEGKKASITREVDSRGHIVYETTGASTELGKALTETLNAVSGVSLRVGNDDGSLVNYVLQVVPREGDKFPTADEINAFIKNLTQTPEKEGGLKGFLGYGAHKTSLEIVGSDDIGGIFDPSRTHVNPRTGTVTIGIWYDNERGYLNQYVNLALLMGLQQRSRQQDVEIVAQNVVAEPGAYTGRINVEAAKQSGATSVIIGSGDFRNMETRANQYRAKPVDPNVEANKALRKALEAGVSLPIVNIYLNDEDIRRGNIDNIINRQIAAALKDIAPEDIIKVMFSLELAGTFDYDTTMLETLRTAIAGVVGRSYYASLQQEKADVEKRFGTKGLNDYITNLRNVAGGSTDDETLDKYASLLGANIASKVRIAVKVNNSATTDREVVELSSWPSVDGIIFGNSFDTRRIDAICKAIDAEVMPQKRDGLNRRATPRFFVCLSTGSAGLPIVDVRTISSAVNPYNIQVGVAPTLPEIPRLASGIAGRVLPNPVTPGNKVPIRVMLQNATIEEREGFVNLEYAVTELGVHDVLLAHSEVLELTGMGDDEVNELAKEAHKLKNRGMLSGNVIVAVGETESDYSAGGSGAIVREQIRNRLAGLTAEEAANTVIAYEPRWAIGTGRTPTSDEIQNMHSAIRNTVKEIFGVEVSQRIRVIYGGSFTPQNAEQILGLKDVDGALIGGASTKAEAFKDMVSVAEKLADRKNASRPVARKMFMAGNHKALPVADSYIQFVNLIVPVDRTKVEVALGPQLCNISQLTDVYTQDPLEGIVDVRQLTRAEIQGKIVFDRVDLNVPIDDTNALPNDPDTWRITSEARIRAALPGINIVRENGGVAVLVSHFEPKGKNVKDPQSIRFLVPYLEKHLGTTVTFVSDILGSERQQVLQQAKPGDVILFENVRLDPAIAKQEKAAGDTSSDIAARNTLAARLYAGRNPANPTANVIIMSDGFGVAHRNQGSVTGIVPGVPRVAGPCLADEVRAGAAAVTNAAHPIAVIFGGGAKIGDKIPMLKNIIRNTLSKGDTLFIYGGAAFPFLIAKNPNFEAGKSKSLATELTVALASEIIELAEEEGIEVVLLKDVVVADYLPADETETVSSSIVSIDNIPPSRGAFDIGPETVQDFKNRILDSQGRSRFGTIIVNGPAGVFEFEQFRDGTKGVFEAIADATKNDSNPDGATTVLGGGDTGYAAELVGVDERVSFTSTGGGAFLELLEGRGLPGVEALRGRAGELAHHLIPNRVAAYEGIRTTLSDYAAAGVPTEPQTYTRDASAVTTTEVAAMPAASSTSIGDGRGANAAYAPVVAQTARARFNTAVSTWLGDPVGNPNITYIVDLPADCSEKEALLAGLRQKLGPEASIQVLVRTEQEEKLAAYIRINDVLGLGLDDIRAHDSIDENMISTTIPGIHTRSNQRYLFVSEQDNPENDRMILSSQELEPRLTIALVKKVDQAQPTNAVQQIIEGYLDARRKLFVVTPTAITNDKIREELQAALVALRQV